MTKQLDDKLREIKHLDCPGHGANPDNDCIAQIKQAFADEGYRLHLAENVVVIPRKDCMTGQEWYDRFRKDYFETRDKYEFDMDDVWESAKRAAGLSNE
jgi:hypothetical protein